MLTIITVVFLIYAQDEIAARSGKVLRRLLLYQILAFPSLGTSGNDRPHCMIRDPGYTMALALLKY